MVGAIVGSTVKTLRAGVVENDGVLVMGLEIHVVYGLGLEHGGDDGHLVLNCDLIGLRRRCLGLSLCEQRRKPEHFKSVLHQRNYYLSILRIF